MSDKMTDHMNERMTKRMSRNIYIGGSLFSILLLVGLTVDTVRQVPKRENRVNLTQEVAMGKHVWEKNNCIEVGRKRGAIYGRSYKEHV